MTKKIISVCTKHKRFKVGLIWFPKGDQYDIYLDKFGCVITTEEACNECKQN